MAGSKVQTKLCRRSWKWEEEEETSRVEARARWGGEGGGEGDWKLRDSEIFVLLRPEESPRWRGRPGALSGDSQLVATAVARSLHPGLGARKRETAR